MNKIVMLVFFGLFSSIGFASEIKVKLLNTKVNKGTVYVALCDEGTFLTDKCNYEISRVPFREYVVVSFSDVSTGKYAVSAFYDLNNDGKLGTNMLGIPNEPVAISNDAVGRRGPPSYDEAEIEFNSEEPIEIVISLF